MGAAAVVVAEPGEHGDGAFCGPVERRGISPVTQSGLDEALCVAIGAGRRSGAPVRQAG